MELKPRLNIDRKYHGQGLWMKFPMGGNWYLVEHNELVGIIGEVTTWLSSDPWTGKGRYHSPNPSQTLFERLAPCCVGGQR